GTHSGLRVVREILEGVEDVHFAMLTSADVVRHRLVTDIVDAYARWDARRVEARGGPAAGPDPHRDPDQQQPHQQPRHQRQGRDVRAGR
ncbi:MAG: PhoH family protein, partial [Frankiaceae bacterium]